MLLNSSVHQVDTTESSLLITEPYFNLPNLQDVYDQFVFEEYEFLSYHRCTRKYLEAVEAHSYQHSFDCCFSRICNTIRKPICGARLTSPGMRHCN